MIDNYQLVNKKVFLEHSNYVLCAFPFISKPVEVYDSAKNKLFVRYSYDFELNTESEWWYVVKDSKEAIEEYSSNHRNQIRKGLKNFEIREASQEEMKSQGYDIYKKCMMNYNLPYGSKEDFNGSLQTEVDNNIPVEYMAIFKEEEMVGYSKNFIDNNLGLVFYETININNEHRKLYPNYALIHKMNEKYLNIKQFKYVCDGSRNLLHETGIQDFLIKKFKFRRAYCKMDIIYNPKVNLIVKCFYPFRKQIAKIESSKFKKLSALLEQERIRRTFN